MALDTTLEFAAGAQPTGIKDLSKVPAPGCDKYDAALIFEKKIQDKCVERILEVCRAYDRGEGLDRREIVEFMSLFDDAAWLCDCARILADSRNYFRENEEKLKKKLERKSNLFFVLLDFFSDRARAKKKGAK